MPADQAIVEPTATLVSGSASSLAGLVISLCIKEMLARLASFNMLQVLPSSRDHTQWLTYLEGYLTAFI